MQSKANSNNVEAVVVSFVNRLNSEELLIGFEENTFVLTNTLNGFCCSNANFYNNRTQIISGSYFSKGSSTNDVSYPFSTVKVFIRKGHLHQWSSTFGR